MTEDQNKKRALGRGLSALLGPESDEMSELKGTQSKSKTTDFIALNLIDRCEDQPRKYFDEDELVQLAASIKSKGILQPILLRKNPRNLERYEIIAGERRFRAAKIAGLTEIPAILKEITDVERFEIALLENIQRQDLNAIEEGEAYQVLMDRYNYTQENLAEAIGKSRSHIANTLRLLKLPEEAKQLLIDGKISAGHARAILSADSPLDLAKKIVNEGLSVRATEEEIKPNTKPEGSKANTSKSDDIISLESHLSGLIGYSVEIKEKGLGGEVKIFFRNSQELDRLIGKFNALRAPEKVGFAV